MAATGASAAAVTEREHKLGGMRLLAGYVAVGAFLAAAATVSIVIGRGEHATPAIGAFYKSTSTCLGSSFRLNQSGQFVDLGGGPSGKLRLRHGQLTGDVTCVGGGTAAANLALQGKGATAKLTGTIGANHVSATYSKALPAPRRESRPNGRARRPSAG